MCSSFAEIIMCASTRLVLDHFQREYDLHAQKKTHNGSHKRAGFAILLYIPISERSVCAHVHRCFDCICANQTAARCVQHSTGTHTHIHTLYIYTQPHTYARARRLSSSVVSAGTTYCWSQMHHFYYSCFSHSIDILLVSGIIIIRQRKNITK